MVEGEDCDAGCDEGDDGVFVQGVAFAEDGDVEGHDWDKLAAFGEDEGDISDVFETGIAKGGGQGAGDGDQEEGVYNGGCGE